MKTLIIYAYPHDAGYNHAILESVIKGLPKSYETKIIDLYRENFNPVLFFNSENRRRDLKNDPETEEYRDLLTWSEHVIFIFPIWWGGMPAILKGFIDRVFAKGFAYDYAGIAPIGHLKGKTAWIITTNDTPKMYSVLMQHDYGRVLKKQVLKMCGFKKVKLDSYYYLRNSSLAQREKFLTKIELSSSKL